MEEKEYKYNCEKCEFYTNSQAAYKIHIISGKHASGKRTLRCDKRYPEKCPNCDYEPKSNTNYLQHTLIYHSTKEIRKEKFPYYCEKCDYGSYAKQSFETHKSSKRHKLICAEKIGI